MQEYMFYWILNDDDDDDDNDEYTSYFLRKLFPRELIHKLS